MVTIGNLTDVWLQFILFSNADVRRIWGIDEVVCLLNKKESVSKLIHSLVYGS